MIRLDPRQAPPPDYYRHNLEGVLEFVVQHHAQVFTDTDRQWLNAWQSLSVDARRLFVRLLMRQGPWVRTDKLVYAEVPDVATALAELEHAGLVELNGEAPADRLLDLHSIDELGRFFPECARRLRPRRKTEWLVALLSAYTDSTLRRNLAINCGWVRLCCLDSLDRLKLLYFGSPDQDLSTFVLRDLGLVRHETYAVDAGQSVLVRPGVLDRYLEICAAARWLERLDTDESVAGQLADMLRLRLLEPLPLRAGERRRSRLLNELGRWHERRGEIERALDCYAASSRHPARERQVRLLQAVGRAAEAKPLLDAMIAEPWCVEEEVFASRLVHGAHVNPPVVEERMLPFPVERWTPGAIEAHALSELEREGAWGLHLENVLPQLIAGLACWDVVFAPIEGAFTHPFQSAPHDLWWDDFAAPRSAQIDQAIAILSAADDPAACLLTRFDEKAGTACDLTNWRAITRTDLERVLRAMPQRLMTDLIRIVMTCPGRCRTGFPDLFVVHADGRCEFIEVKGPKDQLQPQQRVWLQRLKEHGIAARVLRFRQPEKIRA